MEPVSKENLWPATLWHKELWEEISMKTGLLWNDFANLFSNIKHAFVCDIGIVPFFCSNLTSLAHFFFLYFASIIVFFCYFLVIISCRDKYNMGISVFYRSIWMLLSKSTRLLPAPLALLCTRSWRVWTRKTWWTRCAWPSMNWWRSLSSIVKFSWTISMEPPVLWRSSGLSR